MKFGIWIAVAVIAFLWFNHSKKQRLREREREVGQRNRAGPDAPPLQGEPIVACAHCGLHVPASDAVLGRRGIAFCSEAHRLLQPPA